MVFCVYVVVQDVTSKTTKIRDLTDAAVFFIIDNCCGLIDASMWSRFQDSAMRISNHFLESG